MRIDEKGFWLSKKELIALVAHASTDELRPNQCLVVLDPAKNRAHATDGVRILAATAYGATPIGGAVRSLVPREDAARIARTPKASQFLFEHGGGRAEAIDRNDKVICTISYVSPDETVPDVDPMLNDLFCHEREHTEPAALRFAVNPRFLADLALAQAATDDESSGEFRTPDDELSAITWACGQWRAIIMLVRPGRLSSQSHLAERKRVEWAKALAKAGAQ